MMRIYRETLRYLGYGGYQPDETSEKEIRECIQIIEQISQPKLFSRQFPLLLCAPNTIKTAGIQIQSDNLYKNLNDCEEILFIAATLGMAVDLEIKKQSMLNVGKAAILHAAAAAVLEEFCDQWQAAQKEAFLAKGLYLRPRFSPGYGDFPLSYQPAVLEILDAYRRAGIVLSEGGLMQPEKSITAVIGISTKNANCASNGCETCTKTNCDYKR